MKYILDIAEDYPPEYHEEVVDWDDYCYKKNYREVVHNKVYKRASSLGWILPPLQPVPLPVGFTSISQKPRDKRHRDYAFDGFDYSKLAPSDDSLARWIEYCIRYNRTERVEQGFL